MSDPIPPVKMEDADVKFGDHQRSLFQKRLDEINQQIELLIKEELPEYQSELQILESRRDERMANAEQHRQYMLQVVNNQHLSEMKSLKDSYEQSREDLQNEWLQKLKTKYESLKAEIDKHSTYQPMVRKKKKELPSVIKRKAALSLNQIINDGEIMQDLIQIEQKVGQKLAANKVES
ncbi:hypothetical protein P9112_011199 [Eukaryota sp. TZLM1-RC]